MNDNDRRAIEQYQKLVPVLTGTIRDLPQDPPAFTATGNPWRSVDLASANGAFAETWDSIKATITDAFAETHTGIETVTPHSSTSSVTITGTSPDSDTPLIKLTVEYSADGQIIIRAECRPPTGHYHHQLAFGPLEEMTDDRIRAVHDLALASAPAIPPSEATHEQ